MSLLRVGLRWYTIQLYIYAIHLGVKSASIISWLKETQIKTSDYPAGVTKELENTYAIFSEGERQGISSSISSSLSSPSSPSSLPAMLKDDEVNISGTGSMEGLRLPKEREEGRQMRQS